MLCKHNLCLAAPKSVQYLVTFFPSPPPTTKYISLIPVFFIVIIENLED